MKHYEWTEISLAEVEEYIGKALQVIVADTPIQGILLDVYEDGLHMEIGEGHVIFLDNDTYIKEDTRFEVVKIIEFPDLWMNE